MDSIKVEDPFRRTKVNQNFCRPNCIPKVSTKLHSIQVDQNFVLTEIGKILIRSTRRSVKQGSSIISRTIHNTL